MGDQRKSFLSRLSEWLVPDRARRIKPKMIRHVSHAGNAISTPEEFHVESDSGELWILEGPGVVLNVKSLARHPSMHFLEFCRGNVDGMSEWGKWEEPKFVFFEPDGDRMEMRTVLRPSKEDENTDAMWFLYFFQTEKYYHGIYLATDCETGVLSEPFFHQMIATFEGI